MWGFFLTKMSPTTSSRNNNRTTHTSPWPVGYAAGKNSNKTVATTATTPIKITKPDQTNDTLFSTQAILNQRKAVVTLLILTILYWICCAPLITLFSLWPNVYYSPDKLLMNVAFYLYYAYSGINSLVYILRTKKLRKYFCTILRNRKFQPYKIKGVWYTILPSMCIIYPVYR